VHSPLEVPELDLVIRTGGEKRLSDFLLWESAYAELYFTDRLWPDFSVEDLELAVADFARRQRRFGTVAAATPGAKLEPERAGVIAARLPRRSRRARGGGS
jgi:hypothetical protein